MRHYTIYIFALILVSFGCNKTPKQQPDTITEVSDDTKNITPNDIESLRFDDYTLSEDSNIALENWQKYQELNEQIGYIYKADFSFFNGEKKILKTFINDFKTEMPESIKTAPILSRTTALETMILKLNSTLKLDNVDKPEQLRAVKGLLIAMANLNLQINKKFELEANLVDKNDSIE